MIKIYLRKKIDSMKILTIKTKYYNKKTKTWYLYKKFYKKDKASDWMIFIKTNKYKIWKE